MDGGSLRLNLRSMAPMLGVVTLGVASGVRTTSGNSGMVRLPLEMRPLGTGVLGLATGTVSGGTTRVNLHGVVVKHFKILLVLPS